MEPRHVTLGRDSLVAHTKLPLAQTGRAGHIVSSTGDGPGTQRGAFVQTLTVDNLQRIPAIKKMSPIGPDTLKLTLKNKVFQRSTSKVVVLLRETETLHS